MPSSRSSAGPGGLALPARFGGGDGELWLLAALTVVFAIISVVPMGRVLVEAVAPKDRLDLQVLETVLGSASTWRIAGNTLAVGLGGMALALVVGTVMAVLVALTNLRLKLPLVFCFMLPVMIPAQVTALSWIELFQPSSAVMRLLGFTPAAGTLNPMYSPEGIAALLGVHASSLVFISVRAGLRALPRELLEAAQAAGARRWRVLADVVLPLMTPSLVAGAALAFVSGIGNFGIPALLGIPAHFPVLATLIYQRLQGFGPAVLPEVASISLVLAAMALAGIVVQGMVLRRADFRIVGAAAAALPYDLGRARPAVEAAVWLLIAIILVLPLVALIQTSMLPAYGVAPTPANLTLEHYRYVLFTDPDSSQSVLNSLALSLGAAVLLVVLATPFAYFLVWKPNWMVRVVNVAVEIPYAVPGTVVAIAAIMVFLPPRPVIGSLYSTIWIIFAAYLIRFLNRALRPIAGAVHQIDRTLDEAAAMCGAALIRRLRTIILPLLAPAAIGSMLIVFLAAFNELTVSALLWSAGNETIGVMIFNLKDAGDTLEASAMSVVTVVITVVMMLLLSATHRAMPQGAIPWRD